MSAQTLRMATFNIHSAFGAQRKIVGQLLIESGAEVICLQECSQGSVDALCGMLRRDSRNWRAVVAPADWGFANAILSPYAFSRINRARLTATASETRSAALARLTLPSGKTLHVCATHLDHRTEAARLGQWAQLREQVFEETVLCGDFNALRRSDSSDAVWQSIAAIRARNAWEEPRSTLIDALVAEGFCDAGADSPESRTCRFDTRIDYIWHGPSFPGAFSPGSYRVIPAIATRISDHELVVVNINLR